MNLSEKRIAFFDLDGTLIETVSGKTFAEDVTDFRIKKNVLDKIKEMKSLRIVCIVTNQGGIPEYTSKKDFEAKLKGIQEFIQAYLNSYSAYFMSDDDPEVFAYYCDSLDKSNPNRKPNTGMLQQFLDDELKYATSEMTDRANMLMVGDASGKPGQFSDSDKKCAENFGIDYLDVDDFLNQ